METIFHSIFTHRIQGKPGRALCRTGVWAALFTLLAASSLPCALADGGSSEYTAPPSTYGPPPELPPGSGVDDDPPRRDIHMGTVDHMRMGRDDEGNIIMEVRPRPKKVEQQPQVGPFFIYPQIGVPGGMMGQPGMGRPGMGQPGMGQTGSGGNGGAVRQQGGQAGQYRGQTLPGQNQELPATGESSDAPAESGE
ncbi:hypothetical protein [Solidesulfovibrio sp. C21]|uniref:hypothetical protein n=1 Tax=Solidesulfovibrio sp. C21 TaxID=3398613 RepID=UPI0039FD1A23